MMGEILPKTLAYCAGVIDSDGCIRVAKRRGTTDTYHEVVRVKQVERQAIDLLAKTFGGHCNMERAAGRRDMFIWTVASIVAHRCLIAVLPYLRIKKRQAINALALRAVVTASKKLRVYNNKRGLPRGKRFGIRMDALYTRSRFLNRVGVR